MSISSLSEDIFVAIAEVLVPSNNDLRALRLNTLQLVCQRWSEVIQQTPSLWTYIWNGANNTYVEQALLRSKPLGLQVRVSSWRKVKNQDKEGFWSAILRHVDRWEHMELQGMLSDGIPQALAHTAAPILRSLNLDSRGWLVFDGLLPWPLPQLEKLQLRRFDLPWTSLQFPSSRLKYLYILGPPDPGRGLPVTPPQLFDILRGFPELVQLHLAHLYIDDNVPERQLTPISLPKLEKLTLLGLSPPTPRELFETLQAPKCRQIVLDSYDWHTPVEEFQAIKSLIERIGTTQVQNRATLEVRGLADQIYMECNLRGGSNVLHLKLGISAFSLRPGILSRVRPLLHHWVDFLGPSAEWDIRVAAESTVSMSRMLPILATCFPMASTLTITHPASFTVRGFQPKPLVTLYRIPREMAFPFLGELEIPYCREFAGDIFQIAIRRLGGGDAAWGGVTPVRMRIKVPKDMDEVERVELAWLEDQIPNLTIQETTHSLLRA